MFLWSTKAAKEELKKIYENRGRKTNKILFQLGEDEL